MIDVQTHSCRACGEQFVVACLTELQQKLKTHCCKSSINKKRERSEQFRQDRIALFVHDTVVNRIEQYRFDKLIKQGMLVNA